MTYQEYLSQKQKTVNELPIFWAFSDEQYDRAMQERGLDPEKDIDKVVQLPYGGLCLKKDLQTVKDILNKPDRLPELMKDAAFAEEAFYYEMKNHEYHYNMYQGDWDVCSCFGNCEWDDCKDWKDYLNEAGYGEATLQAFQAAKDRFFQDCDKYDWY